MNLADQMAKSIIKEHAKIIGPIAWEEAAKVIGLNVDIDSMHLNIVGDSSVVLKDLVKHFEVLFGMTAREVSRAAVRPLLSSETKDILPSILR